VAVHVTIVIPTGNPPAEALFVIVMVSGSSESVAIAAPSVTVVKGPVASAVISGGAVMVGGIWSTHDALSIGFPVSIPF